MAAVTPSQSQVGRLSFSARYTGTGDPADVANNAALLACCEQGPLYQFFSTAYASDAALLDEWAASGGLLSVQTVGGGAPVPVPNFVRDINGKPTISFENGLAGALGIPVSVRVALSYSASR